MTWVKFDDQATFHAKVIQAGNEVAGAWFRMTCWCSAHLTDGFLPEHVANLIAGRAEVVREAVAAGLLDEAPGGVRVHDYLDHNPSRDEVLKRREAERSRKSSEGKRGGRPSKTLRTESDRNPAGSPAPSERLPKPRPDPDPVLKKRESARAPAPKRGADAAALCDVLASRAELFGSADLIAVSARLEVTLEQEPKADRLDRRQVGRELVADVEAYSAKFTGSTPEQRVAQLSRKLAWILGDVASGRRKDAGPRHDPTDGFPDLDAAIARLGAGA